MSTIREHIAAAMLGLLNTGTPSGVPAATRSRLEQYEASRLPAICLYPTSEDVEMMAGGPFAPVVKRTMIFRVECRAIGDPADTALDPLLSWVTKALCGKTISGYGHYCHELDTQWDFAAADKDYGLAAVRLSVQYSTKTDDQETQE